MSEVWEFMWEALPPGFRFHPTDEEFVDHYLKNYVFGIKDNVIVIPVVDDLFKRDPWELPLIFRGSSIIRSKDPEWWFLSTLKNKSQNCDKFDRSTSTGSWKITGKAKEIRKREGNRLIAVMRNLVFSENMRNEETNWVFHEYHLNDESFAFGLSVREQRKYVLCHLVNRQYDYAETLAKMEVDLKLEGRWHGFSEDTILEKIRSLTEGLSLPATVTSLDNPRHGGETIFMEGPEDLDEMEQVMSTSSGDEDSMQYLLDQIRFSADEQRAPSGEFEVASVYKPLLELEETSREAVVKENRRGRPPEALEGYIVMDETRRFVEDDFQRAEDGDALGLNRATSLHKHPVCYSRRMEVQSADIRGSAHRSSPIVERRHSTSPGRYHNVEEAKGDTPKATRTQRAAAKPPLTPEVRRNPSTRLQTLQSEQGKDKAPVPTTSRAGEECRAPIDYLVNLGAGILVLVLILLCLIMD